MSVDSRLAEYNRFVAEVLPGFRDADLLGRIIAAFEIDDRFKKQIGMLLPKMQNELRRMPRDLLLKIMQDPLVLAAFSDDDAGVAEKLLTQHILSINDGGFDEEYLVSLEHVALFFVWRGVQPLALVGAMHQNYASIMQNLARQIGANGLVPNLLAVMKLQTVEINQMQRVFITAGRKGIFHPLGLAVPGDDESMEPTATEEEEKAQTPE